MIQELISTSYPKCLDGNQGFGVVAQTTGIAPNLVREVNNLSGYTHLFGAGDPRNPVAFLHLVRRTLKTDIHIVSRIADCGNDYSGRTNRIAHQLIIDELDLPSYPCGPAAAILLKQDSFRRHWSGPTNGNLQAGQLPTKVFPVRKCDTWATFFGDAGWGGVVAERAEKGDPISLIFEPGMNLLPLLAEAFALLPPDIRWKTTFSTFFMKSQEPPGTNKVQIKCILASSPEMEFARLTPNTLFLDLRWRPTETPTGKYVENARTGIVTQPVVQPVATEKRAKHKVSSISKEEPQSTFDGSGDTFDLAPMPVNVPLRQYGKGKSQHSRKTLSVSLSLCLLLCIFVFVVSLGISSVVNHLDQKHQQSEQQSTENKKENKPEESLFSWLTSLLFGDKAEQERKEAAEKAEKAEQERKEADAKAVAEKAEQERKEADAKAAAEKAERERKLRELPDVWEDCGLSVGGSFIFPVVLKNSQFLWEMKEHVTISYAPFVNLNQNVIDRTNNAGEENEEDGGEKRLQIKIKKNTKKSI